MINSSFFRSENLPRFQIILWVLITEYNVKIHFKGIILTEMEGY